MTHVLMKKHMMKDIGARKLHDHITEWLEVHVGPRCNYHNDTQLGKSFKEIMSQRMPCPHHNWSLRMNDDNQAEIVFRDPRMATLFKLIFA